MPKARIDDTLQMYYEDDDFTDPWATPETVVMHHGNSKSSRMWYAWVPLLSRQFRVVRLDARGYGRSTVPPPGYPWSLGNFDKDLKALLDHLGLDSVHLIGETAGGTICLQFAYEYPERLKSLTLCTSPYKFPGATRALEHRDLVERGGVEAWVRSSMDQRLDPSETSPEHVAWYIEQMSGTTKHVVTETLTYLATQDLSHILPKINVPTQIIVGGKNPQAQTVRSEGMQALIPGSRVAVIPAASGFVQHSHPERCVEVWREFMAGLP